MKSLKVNWVPLTSQTRLKAVAEGKVDMECGMTTVTMGAPEGGRFQQSHLRGRGQHALREDTNLRRTADLAGRKLAVLGGTTTEQMLRQASRRCAWTPG